MAERIVIVGASIGGVRTAQALRSEGHRGSIVIVGTESELPYDKPPLSKQYLVGEWEADRVRLLDGEGARNSAIELRLGAAAVSLDLADRRVDLADGSELCFDRLVIATGARARPAPWRAESGVHVLRTLEDSSRLRAALRRTGPVVVVGGGFIGAEVAAAACRSGRHVTIVDPLTAPAERVVGPEIGAVLATVHDRHGVATRFGTEVARVEGCEGALAVELTDGQTLRADTVVVGIGAIPETGWLEDSGLLVEDGVVCRADCRSVEDDGVFAVGDCARCFHPRYEETVRIEHWTNTAEQATCVAHNLTHSGERRTHSPIEYVWSDQYDWRVQIAGRPDRYDVTEIFGDADAEFPRFAALYRDDSGGLGGAVTVNWARALVTARRHMMTGTTYDAARAAIAERLTAVIR